MEHLRDINGENISREIFRSHPSAKARQDLTVRRTPTVKLKMNIEPGQPSSVNAKLWVLPTTQTMGKNVIEHDLTNENV